MNDQAKCDGCHETTRAWSELRLDAYVLDGTFPEFQKQVESDGKVSFKFCPFCIFATPKDEANFSRVVALIKQTLGVNEINHDLLN